MRADAAGSINQKSERRERGVVCVVQTSTPLGNSTWHDNGTPSSLQVARSVMNNFYVGITATVTSIAEGSTKTRFDSGQVAS